MKGIQKILMGLFIVAIFMNFSSASYIVSSPQFTNPLLTITSPTGVTQTNIFNSQVCQQGQDFIMQIVPGGCTPTVVRSDLLEQQPVEVDCPIEAMKVNPAVNIKSIVSMSFGGNYPPDVQTVAFMPTYPALGINTVLNNMQWNVIGYVAIFLKQNANESSMPDYVTGNLSATVEYNAYDAFGSVDRTLYLPLLTDNQFNSQEGEYAFFNNMGYLRADDIQTGSATISIYSGTNANQLSSSTNVQKQKLLSYNLNVGQSSPSFFLPGFGCFASSTLQLDSIGGADTRALISINSEEFEVAKGEQFLNGTCTVTSDPIKEGLRESVSVYCNTDQGGKSFTLNIEPSINLKITNSTGTFQKPYQVGDYLYQDGQSGVYLGYVGTDPNAGSTSLTNSLVYLVSIPGKTGGRLDSSTIDDVSSVADRQLRTDQSITDFAKTLFGNVAQGVQWLWNGNNYQKITYGSTQNAFGSTVQITSFGTGTNLALSNATLTGYYANSVKKYKQIQSNFASEVYPDGNPTTLGEESLAQLINLSNILQQDQDLKQYCDDFKTEYPSSTLDVSPCNGVPEYSNTGVSTQQILVNGGYLQVSLDGISVPGVNDYGVELTIRKGSQVESVKMTKGDTIYLDPLFSSNTAQIFSMNNAIGSSATTINQPIYFDYTNLSKNLPQQWYWSTDQKSWILASSNAAAPNGMALSANALSLIKSLSGQSFTDGQTKILGGLGNAVYSDSVTLVQITDQNDAVFNFNLANISKTGSVINFLTSNNYNLKLNVPDNAHSNQYVFILSNVSLSKVAKVSVHTNVRDTSNVNFQFKIGIEKSSIQLSPSQIKSQMATTAKLTSKLESISKSLGSLVNVMQDVCMGVGAILTVKNMIANSGTEAAARTQVMNGVGGWNSICAGEVQKKQYPTMDACLLANSNQIDDAVSQMSTAMDAQNKELAAMQQNSGVVKSGGLFGNDIVDQNKLMTYYAPNVVSSLPSVKLANPNNPNDPNSVINPSTIAGYLTAQNFNNGVYTVDQAEQIELYSKLYAQNSSNKAYQNGLYAALSAVQNNYNARSSVINAANNLGVEASQVVSATIIKNAQTLAYTGSTYGKLPSNAKINIPSLDPNTPVQIFVAQPSGDEYLFVLSQKGTTYYTQKDTNNKFMIFTYPNGQQVTDTKVLQSLEVFDFQAAASGNAIKNPEVDYYNTGTYTGFPGLVPIDPKNGWYVYIPDTSQTASPLLSSTTATTSPQRSYDASGRVNSFWLCNVGQNGLMTQTTDGCQSINLGNTGTYNNIGGLTSTQAAAMINNAVTAINQAQTQYRAGVSTVKILGNTYKVGNPVTSTTTAQCTDIMSPSDCELLFNSCDPVVCPSSRCNFGGKYPVENVIQSGVIGSIMLCLPNWNEGVYIPVCLTGVKAGVDNIISVLNSYESCLNTSLNTGSTIGICKEIESVYLCQMFWNEAIPLANLGVPRLDSLIFGTGASGGGEYIGGIQGALNSAETTVNYFTQNYAVSAFSVFKARSQSDIGTAVCKNAASLVFPQYQGALNALTQAQSPPQYTGNFQTIPFSTVTNPPQDQYNVYYHIFAGNDAGAYYQVYLKNSGGSYYQDTSIPRIVDSGYIPAGQSEDNTKSFTASEGYNQLCIQVNNQESCGFGTVSTNFAANYLSDQYIQDQASTTNITTQSACLSGSPNLLSLLNLNVQNGVTNTLSPNIASSGITRVCASVNPGNKTDPYMNTPKQRWINVGYCDNPAVRCWIDTQSIVGAVNFQTTAGQTLQSLSSTLSQELAAQNGLYTPTQGDELISSIMAISNPFARINAIEGNYSKVSVNNQKGYLNYLEGLAYQNLSIGLYQNLMKLGMIAPCNSPNACFNTSLYSCTSGTSFKSPTCSAGFMCCPQGSLSATQQQTDQFANYISNVYNYIEQSTSGSPNNYNYCYQFRDGTWYWAIKTGSSCGTTVTTSAVGSVVNGQGFLQGISTLIDRVEADPSHRSLSAGQFTLGGGDTNFKGDQNTKATNLTFDISQSAWTANYGDGRGFVRINNSDPSLLSMDNVMTNEGKNIIDGRTDFRDLILNLTNKNLYQGALVLFEGRGFNFAITTQPASPASPQGAPLTQQNVNQLSSLTPYVIQTSPTPPLGQSQEFYVYSFVYSQSNGWYFNYTKVQTIYGSASSGSISSPWSSVDNFASGSGFIDLGNLIISLQSANYLTGIQNIINYVYPELSKQNGEYWSLSYGNVSIKWNGITLSNQPNVGEIDFVYNSNGNNKWMYGYTINSLYDVTSIQSKTSGGFLGFFSSTQSMTQDEQNLVTSLYGKNQLDGTKTILLYGQNQQTSSQTTAFTIPSSCSKYYSQIQNAATTYSTNGVNIDPKLILAVMIQESVCNPTASSGSSYGLMQINTGTWCGQYGLSSNQQTCTQQLLDPTTNINVGTQIILHYYNQYGSKGVTFNGCNIQKNYAGWNASLRAYNGLGCNSNYPSQDYYVENVMKIYTQLQATNLPLAIPTSITATTTAQQTQPSTNAMGNHIVSIAKSLIGTFTTRVLNGQIYYDYVCSTFTSKVLISAGALPQFSSCDASATPELQINKNLSQQVYPANNFVQIYNYKSSSNPYLPTAIQPGDIIIWGCQPLASQGGESYCDSNEFQHSSIFESYSNTNGYQIINDPYSTSGVIEQNQTNSSSWYITHVWRSQTPYNSQA